jgi:hypothetical protein
MGELYNKGEKISKQPKTEIELIVINVSTYYLIKSDVSI